MLWRSAVSAAGQALAGSPGPLPGNFSLGTVTGALQSPSGAIISSSGLRDSAGGAHEGGPRVWGDGNFFLSLSDRTSTGKQAGSLVAVAHAADGKITDKIDKKQRARHSAQRRKTERQGKRERKERGTGRRR